MSLYFGIAETIETAEKVVGKQTLESLPLLDDELHQAIVEAQDWYGLEVVLECAQRAFEANELSVLVVEELARQTIKASRHLPERAVSRA